MISRSEPLSAANAAQLFRATVDPKRIGDVLNVIMTCAEGKDHSIAALDDKTRAKIELEYRQLVLSYGIGRARAQGLNCYQLDLGPLSTSQECMEAMRLIAQHQHLMTTEQAADLRATVLAASQILRTKAGEDLLDEIENAGGIVEYVGVNERREAVLSRLDRRLQEEEGRGN